MGWTGKIVILSRFVALSVSLIQKASLFQGAEVVRATIVGCQAINAPKAKGSRAKPFVEYRIVVEAADGADGATQQWEIRPRFSEFKVRMDLCPSSDGRCFLASNTAVTAQSLHASLSKHSSSESLKLVGKLHAAFRRSMRSKTAESESRDVQAGRVRPRLVCFLSCRLRCTGSTTPAASSSSVGAPACRNTSTSCSRRGRSSSRTLRSPTFWACAPAWLCQHE